MEIGYKFFEHMLGIPKTTAYGRLYTVHGTHVYLQPFDSVSNALHKEPPPLRRRPRCTRTVHPRGHVFDSLLSHACVIVSIVIVVTCSSINNLPQL